MQANNLTFQKLMVNSLVKFRERVYAKFGDDQYTYLDVHLGSSRVANALKKEGFGPGDRIGIILPNSIEYLYCVFGIIKSGAAMIGINMMAGDNDIAFIANDAKLKLLIIDASMLERIEKLRPQCLKLKKIVVIGARTSKWSISFDEFQGKQSDKTPELNAKSDDDCWIVYTGGTTGRPKGVVHSHQTFFFFTIAQTAGLNWLRDDSMLIMTPLGHAAGAGMFSGVPVGAKFIIEKQFDPFKLLEIIEKERVKKVFMIPTIIYVLLDILKQKKHDMSSLETIYYGASPIAPSRLAEAIERFGPILIQKYGQTECPNMVTTLTIEDHLKALENPKFLLSCGRPDVLIDLKILDDNDKEVKPGEVGEICVQAPFVMKGYLDQPELTKQVIIDGWLHTGDMGKVDEEGYVYIVDRKKDMVISGGMNVYPAEVEKLISQHPKVKQVAVIGIPDEKWGEAVTAIIIPDGELNEQEIKDYCRDKLSKYAQPKYVVFQQSIPVTFIGKIDKKALRAPYWEGKERAIQ